MKLSFIAISLLLVGCVSHAPPPSAFATTESNPISRTTTRELRKNYEIGVAKIASVGEPIIAVRDYLVTTEERPGGLVPSHDFKIFRTDIYGEKPIFAGSKGQIVPVIATASIDGRKFYVIQQRHQAQAGLMLTNMLFVGEDGHLLTDRFRVRIQLQAMDETNNLAVNLRTEPSDLIFSMASNKVNEIEAKGYINYEIVFTGKSSNQLNFVYREFSREDLAKQAFFQNLTYSAEERHIRFRNLLVRVDRVNNEGISYVVLQD